MDLTIIGCGYVGLALAERLQPRRPQLRLTLTTTSSERLEQLSPLADRVELCDATDPVQLRNALRQSSSAVFCLGPKEIARWMPTATATPSSTASAA